MTDKCLSDNSPCKLFFVSRDTAIKAVIMISSTIGLSVGGLIWKASAYASQVETLTVEVQELKTSQTAILDILLDIQRNSRDNNNLLKHGKWKWSPQP